MADPKHVEILKQGVEAWNDWREENPDLRPDLLVAELREAYLPTVNLREVDLTKADLRGANLREANLSRAILIGADLTGADLTAANLVLANLIGTKLTSAKLEHANLSWTDLTDADLCSGMLGRADLGAADLRRANLTSADLRRANLSLSNLRLAKLSGANLHRASVGQTVFADIDLSQCKGLETVSHHGPSTVGVDTVYRSKGEIPEIFLRGTGIPDSFITQMKALVGAMEPIQFYSCFISYSTKDQEFADRLHADLQAKGVRCWFAPHDIKAGEKIHEQIDEAIRRYDKLLLILSPQSINSEWVKTEIATARKKEIKQQRRMLFPLRLVDFETLRDWECFDADTGKDSAREIREFFIPDFSNWKDHDSYKEAFDRLLRDLKASGD